MAHRDGLVSEEIGVVDLRLRRQAFFSLTDTIARYSTGYVPYRTSDSYGFLEMRAGSEGDWAVNGDSLLAVVSDEPPTLTWWRSGNEGFARAGTLELPLDPEPFTQDDVSHLLERTNEDRSTAGYAPLPRTVEIDPPRYWGQIGQLVISNQEESWIQWNRPRSEEGNEWFRVHLSTKELARVGLPSWLSDARGGWLARRQAIAQVASRHNQYSVDATSEMWAFFRGQALESR